MIFFNQLHEFSQCIYKRCVRSFNFLFYFYQKSWLYQIRKILLFVICIISIKNEGDHIKVPVTTQKLRRDSYILTQPIIINSQTTTKLSNVVNGSVSNPNLTQSAGLKSGLDQAFIIYKGVFGKNQARFLLKVLDGPE